MKIKKENPSWTIICDSKINSRSFQRYTTTVSNDFEIGWIKANGKAPNTSNAEKILELLAIDFLGLKNDKNLPNDKFLEQHFKALEPFFDHFSATVVFNNVSQVFIQNVLLEKLCSYNINQKKLTDLSLFLPPSIEDTEIQNVYGQLVGNIFESVQNFIEEAKRNGVSEQEATNTALTMMPIAQQSKAIMTASMGSWRKLLISLSEFGKDEETRYVIMHLLRDLKARYIGFFSDMVLENKDRKQFGVDSLSNEGFWQTVKVNKRL